MNKTELVAEIAKNADLSKKDAEAAVKALTDVVAKELKKGGKVQLVGFGTFEVSKRAARTGRNPQTGKDIKIPASKAPKTSDLYWMVLYLKPYPCALECPEAGCRVTDSSKFKSEMLCPLKSRASVFSVIIFWPMF